jgi:hydrogenase/urease accessory protein HupE
MRWIVQIDPKDQHEPKGDQVHRHGLIKGCMHPLFGFGVSLAVVAVAVVAYMVVR